MSETRGAAPGCGLAGVSGGRGGEGQKSRIWRGSDAPDVGKFYNTLLLTLYILNLAAI